MAVGGRDDRTSVERPGYAEDKAIMARASQVLRLDETERWNVKRDYGCGGCSHVVDGVVGPEVGTWRSWTRMLEKSPSRDLSLIT